MTWLKYYRALAPNVVLGEMVAEVVMAVGVVELAVEVAGMAVEVAVVVVVVVRCCSHLPVFLYASCEDERIYRT